MDSCLGVEQDLDKATTKFTAIHDHTNKVLQDLITQVETIKQEISQRKELFLFIHYYHWLWESIK